ncbi:SIFV.gp27-like protein [Sulfolobus islandicus filamentous virus 2]|uniref:SIFV.gp27-like protein n=1 Tax=Sulfolobus islandicus filamentous virus 2 TaxID=1902331 RepID=A0A1D8BJ83_SIFV|nr:SIFV.gp27-like protein [Sulfolobus islandicus filamentous virus 2]
MEEFIVKIAESKGISNLKSYHFSIISNYENFFNFILPKDVVEILVVLPFDEEKTKTIKHAITNIRGKASITIMYSEKIRDKMVIGWRT